MTTERFQELQSIYIDGNPSPSELEELAAMLRADATLVRSLQDSLMFVDLVEQSLQPERSENAFSGAMETRVRAERSADAFMEELIPKLQEVDAAKAQPADSPQEEDVVVSVPMWKRTLPAAAAGVALLAGAYFLYDYSSQVAPALASEGPPPPSASSKAEMTIHENRSVIRWDNGDYIEVGEPIRIESGVALISVGPGKSLTVEGPAEFVLRSPNEGDLIHGKLVAKVDNGEEPFLIHVHKTSDDTLPFQRASQMVVQVSEGSTGVSSVGNDIEASVFSKEAEVAIEFESQAQKLGPLQSTIARNGMQPRLENAPFDLTPYKAHWPLLSWVSDFSDPIQIGMPGATDPFQGDADQPGAIRVYLERERVRLDRPLWVDVVPDAQLDLAKVVGSRKKLSTTDDIRSYLVQLDALHGKAASQAPEFVDAYITFDHQIVALSTSTDTLSQSDGLTGYDLEAYVQTTGLRERGLADGDEVSIREDGRTLDFRMKLAQRSNPAQVRVFVLAQ